MPDSFLIDIRIRSSIRQHQLNKPSLPPANAYSPYTPSVPVNTAMSSLHTYSLLPHPTVYRSHIPAPMYSSISPPNTTILKCIYLFISPTPICPHRLHSSCSDRNFKFLPSFPISEGIASTTRIRCANRSAWQYHPPDKTRSREQAHRDTAACFPRIRPPPADSGLPPYLQL